MKSILIDYREQYYIVGARHDPPQGCVGGALMSWLRAALYACNNRDGQVAVCSTHWCGEMRVAGANHDRH
jgi:hypothetical protein